MMTVNDFTEEELKELHWMMQATWNNIGMDVLQSQAEMENIDREQVCMGRDSVIDVVLDAGHIEMDAAQEPEQVALMKRFRQLSFDDQTAIARQTFSFEHYGM